MCSKKTKTAGLLKNEINDFVGLHFFSIRRTHKQACNYDFAKERAWILKFFCLKNAWIGWQAERNAATQSSRISRGLGVKLLSLGDFFIFQEKITISMSFGSLFARF